MPEIGQAIFETDHLRHLRLGEIERAPPIYPEMILTQKVNFPS